MDNQERNREALIEHIAEQDRIIRRRNEQIAQQAENAREAQNTIEDIEAELEAYRAMHSQQIKTITRRNDRIAEVEARADELARELAHAVTRAEKAEMESGRAAEVAERWREAYDDLVTIRRTDPHRPLTADEITYEMVCRAQMEWERRNGAAPIGETIREILTAALTEPTSPEEKVERVLRRYWSGDVDGTDLADLIVEEMNR